MGLFFYTKKGSIISTVDLPTTEIIEPFFTAYRKMAILGPFCYNSCKRGEGYVD